MVKNQKTIVCLLAFILVVFGSLTATAASIVQYENSSGYLVEGSRCEAPTPTAESMAKEAFEIQNFLASGRYQPLTKAGVNVPVAIHVVTYRGSDDVSDAAITAQMQVLNDAYLGTPFSFTLVSVDRTDNRKWSTAGAGSRNANEMKAALAVDPATTLNVYFTDIGGGTLGYSYLPSQFDESSTIHGVVCALGTVPGGASAPYNEGDTATHEVGHYLGLMHTFNGGCNGGDAVDDTAPEASAAFGCPDGRDTCAGGGPDPIHNFMDYTDDYCMYEFTAGQSTRMDQQVALYKPTLYGTPSTGPAANFSGTPTSGDYPLVVQFNDASTGSPTSWSWTFGDGGTSTSQNPSHTYNAAGSYSVSLTVTSNDGSDTLTRSGYINATEPGSGGTMHVSSVSVSRQAKGPNVNGVGTITVVDSNGQPVSGATISVTATGPSGGSGSATTGADGSVTFTTAKVKNPTGEWCFEVTNVAHASLTYDVGGNVVTRSCESGPVFRDGRVNAAMLTVDNYPNPFNPMTAIKFNMPREGQVSVRIYDSRGSLVTTLLNGHMGAGERSVNWDARGHASGVYFAMVNANGEQTVKKMALLK